MLTSSVRTLETEKSDLAAKLVLHEQLGSKLFADTAQAKSTFESKIIALTEETARLKKSLADLQAESQQAKAGSEGAMNAMKAKLALATEESAKLKKTCADLQLEAQRAKTESGVLQTAKLDLEAKLSAIQSDSKSSAQNLSQEDAKLTAALAEARKDSDAARAELHAKTEECADAKREQLETMEELQKSKAEAERLRTAMQQTGTKEKDQLSAAERQVRELGERLKSAAQTVAKKDMELAGKVHELEGKQKDEKVLVEQLQLQKTRYNEKAKEAGELAAENARLQASSGEKATDSDKLRASLDQVQSENARLEGETADLRRRIESDEKSRKDTMAQLETHAAQKIAELTQQLGEYRQQLQAAIARESGSESELARSLKESQGEVSRLMVALRQHETKLKEAETKLQTAAGIIGEYNGENVEIAQKLKAEGEEAKMFYTDFRGKPIKFPEHVIGKMLAEIRRLSTKLSEAQSVVPKPPPISQRPAMLPPPLLPPEEKKVPATVEIFETARKPPTPQIEVGVLPERARLPAKPGPQKLPEKTAGIAGWLGSFFLTDSDLEALKTTKK